MKTWMRLALLALVIGDSMAFGAETEQPPIRNELRWIDRPWEYRYLIHVLPMDTQKGRTKPFADIAADEEKKGLLRRNVPECFAPTSVLPIPPDTRDDEDSFAVTRIDVASDRTVQTRNNSGFALTARLNYIEHVVLSPVTDNPTFVVDFGKFFMGTFVAADLRYSPTMCNSLFGDSVRPDDLGRYVKGFTPSPDGYFGCREWAAQLYDDERPYIDVTSYEMVEDYDQPALKKGPRKGKQPLIPATFVRRFIGFSRYTDPPKPIIGNHKGIWACFNDCPDGDAPGIIPDIKVWSLRHGWAVPKKPKNVREFMDKSGRDIDYEE